jgi:hypothetical protein
MIRSIQAADQYSAAGRCDRAHTKVRDARFLLGQVPSSVDKDVRQEIGDGLDHLDSLISSECQAPQQTQTTPTETTQTQTTQTETTPTETTQTETQPSQTDTTLTTTTPTDTTPTDTNTGTTTTGNGGTPTGQGDGGAGGQG